MRTGPDLLRSLFYALVLAVVPGTTGCVQPKDATGDAVLYDACRPAVLVPEESVSEAEAKSLADAAALWNGLGLTHLSAASADPAVGTSSTAQVIPVHFRETALIFLGEYETATGEVYVNRALEAEEARTLTVAHEVGHAFGLVHVARDARRSVMNPANVDVAPTEGDAAALRALFPSCSRP